MDGIGASDGSYYEDHFDRINPQDDQEKTAPKPQERLYVSPNDLRAPGIEDRRDEGIGQNTQDYLSQNLSWDKAKYYAQNPLAAKGAYQQDLQQRNTIAQPPVPETPMGDDLGLSSIPSTMPPRGPTEPAGALKPEEASTLASEAGVREQSSLPGNASGINLPDIDTVPHHDWVESVIQKAKEAFKLPGDVFGGKIDPMSEQGLERVNDLAGLMIFGPAPVASKMADGTLGSFAGVGSKTINSNKLMDAMEMKQVGQTTNAIHEATGFHTGLDNKWRYEIDDSKAKINPTWADNPNEEEKKLGRKFQYLPDVLDHPELYKAYPNLEQTLVKYDHNYPEGEAAYNSALNTITMGRGTHLDKGTLMHEVQHAIQNEEGFSTGGSPAMVGKKPKIYELKMEKAFNQFQEDSREKWDSINQKYKEKGAMGLSSEDLDHIAHYNKVKTTYEAYKVAADKLSHDYYERLAGETEARNVYRRLQLTETERARMKPWWTQDRPTDTQIHVSDPAWATPYGIRNPYTGEISKDTKYPQVPKNESEELEQLMEARRTNKLMGYDTDSPDYQYYNDRIKELQAKIKKK